QERNQPAFVLHEPVHTPVGSNLPEEPGTGVALRAAAGYELRAGFGVAIAELQTGGRRKVVRRPCLVGSAIAASLITEQISLVGIGVVVLGVVVEKCAAVVCGSERLRGNRFHAKIEFA